MSVINFTGFEGKGLLADGHHEDFGVANLLHFNTESPHGGSYFLRASGSIVGQEYLQFLTCTNSLINTPNLYSTFYLRPQVYPDAQPLTFFGSLHGAVASNTYKFKLGISNSGTLKLYNVSGQMVFEGGTILPSSSWNLVELGIATGGHYELKVNGNLEGEGSGVWGTINHDSVRLGLLESSTTNIRLDFDDLWLDTSSFRGEHYVAKVTSPSGAGILSDWGGAGGYAGISGVPPDYDGSYIATTGEYGSLYPPSPYNLGIPTNHQISGVKLTAICRQSGVYLVGTADSGVGMRLLWSTTGNITYGPQMGVQDPSAFNPPSTINPDYLPYSDIRSLDTNNTQWTTTSVYNHQYGLQRIGLGLTNPPFDTERNPLLCTSLYQFIDYSLTVLPSGYITLAMHGHDTVSSGLSLYISSTPEGNIPLYTLGNDTSSSGMTLFMPSGYYQVPLFLQGHIALNSGLSLYTQAHAVGSSGLSLYENGHIAISGSMNLFLKAHDKVVLSGDVSLFTRGATPGLNELTSTIPLLLEATSGNWPFTTMPLTLLGSPIGDLTSNMNLYVGGTAYELSANTPLYLHGPSGEIGTVSLWISGYGEFPGSVPTNTDMVLYLQRPFEEACPLFLLAPGTVSSGNIPMYIQGNGVSNSGVSLAMPNVVGSQTANTKCFVRGF